MKRASLRGLKEDFSFIFFGGAIFLVQCITDESFGHGQEEVYGVAWVNFFFVLTRDTPRWDPAVTTEILPPLPHQRSQRPGLSLDDVFF